MILKLLNSAVACANYVIFWMPGWLKGHTRPLIRRDTPPASRIVDEEQGRGAGELVRIREEMEAYKVRCVRAEEDTRRLRAEANDQLQRIATLEDHLERSEEKSRDAEERLRLRTKELHLAETFLVKEDLAAERQVVSIVSAINEALLQLASNVADAPEFEYHYPTAANMEARHRIGESCLLGHVFLETLREIRPQDMVETAWTAIQAVLVQHIQRVTSTWDLDISSDSSRMRIVQELHKAMRGRELQSVAGRWRVLARTTIKALPDADKRQEYLMQSLSDIVVDVLMACGVTGPRASLSNVLSTEFASDIRDVAINVAKAHEMIGERVLSRELSLFAAIPGAVFDPATMETEPGGNTGTAGPSAGHGATVLYALQLGMMAEWREDLTDVAKSGTHLGPIRTQCISKCKVVLSRHGGSKADMPGGYHNERAVVESADVGTECPPALNGSWLERG